MLSVCVWLQIYFNNSNIKSIQLKMNKPRVVSSKQHVQFEACSY